MKTIYSTRNERELLLWKGSRRLDRMLLRYLTLLLAVLAVVIGSFFALDAVYGRARALDGIRFDDRGLLRLQLDEETGVRGFDATKRVEFLQPYKVAKPALQASLASLAKRLPPHETDGLALANFARLHDAWEKNVAAPIVRNPADPANPAREDLGKTLMDGMRRDVRAIDDWNARLADANVKTSRLVEYATGALIILCVLIVAAVGYRMERRGARREETLLLSVMEKRDSAARLSEWRSKITAMLAHDFKSTLGAIRAYSAILEDFPERRSDVQPYRGIRQALAQLSTMADEALLMARVSNDQLTVQKEPYVASQLLNEAVERFRVEREIAVPASDELLLGDRSYLIRVFDNVIGNAVKYSPKGSSIDVGIERLPSGELEIRVTDRGDGISAEDLPHVFEEYWRSSRAAKDKGSGVGLFIVRKIMDAHGGSITLRSAPGAGTTVLLRFAPASRVSNATAQEAHLA